MGKNRPKISASVRRSVYTRANWRCQYCGLKFRERYDDKAPMRELGLFLEVDHIVPYLLGGADDWRNMRAACSTCNRKRGCDKEDLWAERVVPRRGT